MSTPSIGRRAENAKGEPGVLSTLKPQIRRGRAATGSLLLALLLLALALAAALFLFSPHQAAKGSENSTVVPVVTPGPSSSGQGGNPRPTRVAEPSSGSGEIGESGELADGSGVGVRLQDRGAPAIDDPSRFRGKGTLRGRLLLPQGAELEQPWAIRVGPSPWLIGSEGAEVRRVERPALVQDFELNNLPLAGYQITIEAVGFTSQPTNVLLQKGADNIFTTVQLERNASVEGTLFQENGVPAEGIAARLQALEGEQAFETKVDIAGKFRFEGVPEGNWRLILGPPTSPYIEPQLLDVRLPGLVLPQATLPPLTWFRVIYLDENDDPIPDVEISGSGNQGGVVHGQTDAFGVFVGRNIVPGRWTLRASKEGFHSRRDLFVVSVEEPYEETLVLLP